MEPDKRVFPCFLNGFNVLSLILLTKGDFTAVSFYNPRKKAKDVGNKLPEVPDPPSNH